jgi:hypothetical protein
MIKLATGFDQNTASVLVVVQKGPRLNDTLMKSGA